MSYRDIMDARDGSTGPQGLRQNAHVAFKTAYELLGNLEQVRDRRKAVILVSNGYDFDPFPQGRTGTDQVFGGRYGIALGGPRARRPVPRAGTAEQPLRRWRSRVGTGGLDRRGQPRERDHVRLDPRGVVGTTSVVDQVDPTEMRTHIGKTQGSLRTLAEATGGFAVVNDNEFDGALKRIDAETSDYYILGYYASNPDPNRRNRSVEVKTRRPGVEVWSRGWYRTRAGEPPAPKP